MRCSAYRMRPIRSLRAPGLLARSGISRPNQLFERVSKVAVAQFVDLLANTQEIMDAWQDPVTRARS